MTRPLPTACWIAGGPACDPRTRIVPDGDLRHELLDRRLLAAVVQADPQRAAVDLDVGPVPTIVLDDDSRAGRDHRHRMPVRVADPVAFVAQVATRMERVRIGGGRGGRARHDPGPDLLAVRIDEPDLAPIGIHDALDEIALAFLQLDVDRAAEFGVRRLAQQVVDRGGIGLLGGQSQPDLARWRVVRDLTAVHLPARAPAGMETATQARVLQRLAIDRVDEEEEGVRAAVADHLVIDDGMGPGRRDRLGRPRRGAAGQGRGTARKGGGKELSAVHRPSTGNIEIEMAGTLARRVGPRAWTKVTADHRRLRADAERPTVAVWRQLLASFQPVARASRISASLTSAARSRWIQ